MKLPLHSLALCLTANSVFAFAGGSDSCLTPEVIVGDGTFAVNTVNSTTGVEGQNEALCQFFGTQAIVSDVWFAWTPTSTGLASISLCAGVVAGDSKVAVYAGSGCPVSGTALACNDDFCGLRSFLTFNVVAGNVYTLQIGRYQTAVGYAGTFDAVVTPLMGNDDCASATAISGTGTFPFTNSIATSSTQGQTEAACNFVGSTNISHDVWFNWTAPATGTAIVNLCAGTTIDSKVAVYPGAGCPTSAAIACNDDACLLQSQLSFACLAGQVYALQLGCYPNSPGGAGTFDISMLTPSFCEGTLAACPCGNTGAPGNGCANSANSAGANLAVTGNASFANDTLVLQATGMPNGAIPPITCVFVQASAQASGVFGDGLRCLSSPMVRLGTRPCFGGTASFGHGVGGDPNISVQGQVYVPGVRYYQVTYRNAAAFCTSSTFNTTNGVTVLWN
jgi:hypothetical protein